MSRFYLRIILPSIFSILLFILTNFFIIIPHFQENIMNGKREMIKELTNSAWSILAKYENDEKNGIISREEAQNTAASRIQYLRYGEESKDYFWITDLHPIMIMHPYRSDLNGKDLSNFADPHGKKIFVEFVNTVKNSDHGYVDYMWQWKDDSTHIVPKLSYVRVFKPWGWVIGTGVYVEDVKKEIDALTNKLLWISVGISLVIAFLLLFISQQSLRIERKRIEAEKELQESKEKYKTLVEAATEGLIMLSDGKISFLNNIICKMSGYESQDLVNLPLKNLIAEKNQREIIEAFSGDIIKEGQYELSLKTKSDEAIEVLATVSTAIFFNKAVNIIILKDITGDRNLNLSSLDYQNLLSTLNIGFFRARIDAKGKIMFANDTAVRILGYNSYRELSEVYILELLASTEDRKNLRSTLLANGFIRNKTIRIYKKNNEPAIVAVTLVVFNNENPNELVCDGIVEDISQQEREKADTNKLIMELKTGSFLIEQPVKTFIDNLYTLDADAPISAAVKMLAAKKTDTLLLTKNGNEPIGIITSSDIQKRVLSLELHPDNPSYLIMSSPVVSAGVHISVLEAITLCEEKGIHHLVMKDDNKNIAGLFRLNDVFQGIKNSLTFFLRSAKSAENPEQLKDLYRTLLLLVKPLIRSEFAVNHITGITSAFSDAATRRVIEMAIEENGIPPARFAFICMGSEGRQEETLFTDQDNAIVYEDVPSEKQNEVNEYFLKLGTRVCQSLNTIGYSFCKGNIMAMNPQWCQPLSVWEKYFANWIFTPEPQNLLDATIFFDFRHISGEESITEKLKTTVSLLVKEHPSFLYHLAVNTYSIKPQQLSSGNIISDKGSDSIDLKSAITQIIMFVRTYSLQNDLRSTNTLARISGLQTRQLITGVQAEELNFVYNCLMRYRFKIQADQADQNLPYSNILNPKRLLEPELSLLKKVLSLITSYQNKIGTDFRVKM